MKKSAGGDRKDADFVGGGGRMEKWSFEELDCKNMEAKRGQSSGGVWYAPQASRLERQIIDPI